jgi:hypothetical protein
MLALALTGPASSACNKSKKKAVPAEVEVDWPDAAVFPEPDRPQPESPPVDVVDAGAPSSEPPTPSSMSTGSDG